MSELMALIHKGIREKAAGRRHKTGLPDLVEMVLGHTEHDIHEAGPRMLLDLILLRVGYSTLRAFPVSGLAGALNMISSDNRKSLQQQAESATSELLQSTTLSQFLSHVRDLFDDKLLRQEYEPAFKGLAEALWEYSNERPPEEQLRLTALEKLVIQDREAVRALFD